MEQISRKGFMLGGAFFNPRHVASGVVFFLIAALLPLSLGAEAWVEGELGLVFTHYNSIQIPGDGGTRFSFASFEQDPAVSGRVRMGYDFFSRHSLSLMASPLAVTYRGTFEQDTVFEGVTFPKDTPIKGTYRFNSYRLTYRYGFVKNREWSVAGGLTAKVRDAEIRLETNALQSSKTNVGFVPLIHLNARYEPEERLFLLLEADALVAPQGRAEDVLVALGYRITPNLWVRVGYRLLEGGSDSGEVYNFSFFHYTTAGVGYRF